MPEEVTPLPENGRCRVVIEGVTPEIDCGRYPAKRVVEEKLTVQADIFADGHDQVAALLLYRYQGEHQWHKVLMRPLGNDRWEADFTPSELGYYRFTIEGRIDHFLTWKKDLVKKYDSGQFLQIDLLIGAELIEAAAARAGADAERLLPFAGRLRDAPDDSSALAVAGEPELEQLMAIHYDPALVSRYGRELRVSVDRQQALFSAWYELFPRSVSPSEGGHGTFRDCEQLLPEIARMGFDVVYFPPIHPIGLTHRKGKNNSTRAEPGDPGSPWAIGAPEGGHKEIHPDLGTLDDFAHFIAAAAGYGLEVAMDIAFQASPDHPYVRHQPEWFRWRPDGTVQYAENPPKKYEDIIPFDFESAQWPEMWRELCDVFRFWIGQGVRIFRVDNPHTKAFGFWEWAIAEIKGDHPEVIFLAEAFTRPKVMYRLAKLGFSQSYTYFSWRNTPAEMEQYIQELTRGEVREFFRPNFWPNTPDILPEFLQYGGRPAFIIRFILAATLSASYGIYGPPFELFVNRAVPGKEEYLDSEKYEIRPWDWDDPRQMRQLIAAVNRLRRDNPALQNTWNVTFCQSDNDHILAYLKATEDRSNLLLVVVSFDPFHPQAGRIRLPLEALGLVPGHPFLVHDLLSGDNSIWHGDWNRVELSPADMPARILKLQPRLRREQDFDYFM
ncbi:MAG: alpha-1,4-glucan--maltose-1-phosphate maltosyltransferase [Desulfuromonadales bacterium]|nr:alpha-1,4-glucan--maltose-1-phosphate maltosyltransferase [Desulfuromonadales bacterium]